MKNGILGLLAAAACLTGSAHAGAASISIPDFEIYPGGEYTASVGISPGEGEMFSYKGYQFDMMLLDGITVSLPGTTVMDGFRLAFEAYPNGNGRFVVFTEEAMSVDATADIMQITFAAPADAAPGQFDIKISGLDFSSPMGVDIFGDDSYFTITVLEPGEEPTPEPGEAGNVWVSETRIREGNMLSMGISDPTGGYDDAWQYVWTDPAGAMIGEGQEISTPALLFGAAAQTGEEQAISDNVYDVSVTNLAPDGTTWYEATLPTPVVHVYKRPKIPVSLLRKGDGTSCTFVVMMSPLTNQEILDLGFTYTYGYTDMAGKMYELETTEKRYTHTTSEIYNDSSLTFWAFSSWTYPDGSIVTSGLRYLDGSEDPDFDASSFSGERMQFAAAPGTFGAATGIFTIDGRYLGTDASVLEGGIYIIRTSDSVKKIIL